MPFISLQVDAELLERIRVAILAIGETDRSKFIRAALREKIRRIEIQGLTARPGEMDGREPGDGDEASRI